MERINPLIMKDTTTKLLIYCLAIIQQYVVKDYDDRAKQTNRLELVLFYRKLAHKLSKIVLAGEGKYSKIVELISNSEDMGHSKEFLDIYKAWLKDNYLDSIDINAANAEEIKF